jgi:osmotically inducible protein OsmC
MTLSLLLARDGHRAERLDVRAKCSLDRDGKWYAVTAMDLEVRGRVPGLDAAAFEASAREADGGCAISNALRGGVELRLSATLED